MGGHGALTVALGNPGRFRSVSAFAPIVAPCQVPWGKKASAAISATMGSAWRKHDAVALIEDGARRRELLVDVGDADPFLEQRAPARAARARLRRGRNRADAAAPAGLRPQLLFHLDLHGRPSALACGAPRAELDWYQQALSLATALACGLLIGVERGLKLREQARYAGRRRPHLHHARAGRRDRRADRRARSAVRRPPQSRSARCVVVAAYARRARDQHDATSAVAAMVTVAIGFLAGIGRAGTGDRRRGGGVALLALRTSSTASSTGSTSRTSRRSPATRSSPARCCRSCPAASMGRSARGIRRSCGWWWSSSPASRSSAMSPTASSASATAPSPPR